MTLADLLAKERELMFRSLALCGVHVVVPLTKYNSFDLSESGLSSQEIKEIHFSRPIQAITDRMEELDFKFKGIVDGQYIYAPSELVLHANGFTGNFKRGDIVQLNMSYQNSPAGTLGYVLAVAKYPKVIFIHTQVGDEIRLSEREAMDHMIYKSSDNVFIKFF